MKDCVPHHKFPRPLETGYKLGDPGPPEVLPPEGNNRKLLIDGVATPVARCGKLFEDLSREKNQSNPLFSFLVGGNGHDYYARKLWEEQQKRGDHTKQKLDVKLSPHMQKMRAESRGQILAFGTKCQRFKFICYFCRCHSGFSTIFQIHLLNLHYIFSSRT